jgi:hypothetical protein
MGGNKKTRRARVRIPEPRNWRTKVDPLYVRIFELYRTIVDLSRSNSPADREEAERLKRNPPEDLLEAMRQAGEELRKTGGSVLPLASTILGSSDTGLALADAGFMIHWLAWNKWGKTLEQLIDEDRRGVEKSSRQLLSVQQEFQRWRYGKQDAEDVQTKFDREHWTLIMWGLDMGVQKLTQEELADFANDVCLCGSKQHLPENLRKLRTRILKFLEVAMGGDGGRVTSSPIRVG